MFKSVKEFLKELRCSGLFGKAHKLHMCKNYESALTTLDQIMALEPPEYLATLVLRERGEIEYRLGRYGDSIKSLSAFVAQEAGNQINSNTTVNKQVERAKEFINLAKSKNEEAQAGR